MLSIASAAVQTRGGAVAARLAVGVSALEEWLASQRHQLILWTPVVLGAGVAAYFGLPDQAQWRAAVCAGLALAAAGLALHGLSGRCLLWGGLLLALGVGLAWTRAEQVAAPRLERTAFARTFEATVIGVDLQAALERYRLLLRPAADEKLPPRVRVSLRQAPPDSIEPGARIRLRATLRPPPGPSVPGGYDFAQRAWFEGVGAVGYALGPVELTAAAPPPGDARAWLDALRRRLTTRFHSAIEGPAGGIAAALVAGDRGGISEEVTEDMRDSGLAHLLSISGMHIAVVVGGTMWLVRHLLLLSPWIALRWPVKIIAAGAAALAGIAYTLLAGAEVPTVRSCIATLIVLVGLCLGRQAISLRMVVAAALLILLVRPEALLGPSFQLSFAAVTAIVVFYQWWALRSVGMRGEASWLRRFGNGLLVLVLTGVLVEVTLAPIALGHFGRTGFYGVAANVVAIPFTSFVIMPAGAAALLLDPIGLGGPAYALLGWSLNLLIGLADTVAGWPGAVSRLPTMPGLAFAGFIVGGLWLFLWEGRVRWAGAVPILAATGLALMATPADLVVSGDGRHAGLVIDGRLAMLRPRAGSFIGDMWSDATATAAMTGWSDEAVARCNRDACVTVVGRGGREWRLLATKSKALIDWRSLTRACAAADIVVSERWLPEACRPRWLKLDRAQLARTGAVAIWFDPLRVQTVADRHGDHPWATAAPPQWYRRSKPTSLP